MSQPVCQIFLEGGILGVGLPVKLGSEGLVIIAYNVSKCVFLVKDRSTVGIDIRVEKRSDMKVRCHCLEKFPIFIRLRNRLRSKNAMEQSPIFTICNRFIVGQNTLNNTVAVIVIIVLFTRQVIFNSFDIIAVLVPFDLPVIIQFRCHGRLLC